MQIQSCVSSTISRQPTNQEFLQSRKATRCLPARPADLPAALGHSASSSAFACDGVAPVSRRGRAPASHTSRWNVEARTTSDHARFRLSRGPQDSVAPDHHRSLAILVRLLLSDFTYRIVVLSRLCRSCSLAASRPALLAHIVAQPRRIAYHVRSRFPGVTSVRSSRLSSSRLSEDES